MNQDMGKLNILLLCVLLVMVFCLTSTVFAADKPIVLKLSDHDTCAGLKGRIGTFWIEEVKKQTEGKVEIKGYWGGTLFSAEEQLKALSDGVVDIAAIYPDFYPNQLPFFGAYWLFPKGPEKWENIRWIYNETMARIPEFGKELKAAGIKILLMENGLPMAYMSRYPVTSLKDLEGKKWRAWPTCLVILLLLLRILKEKNGVRVTVGISNSSEIRDVLLFLFPGLIATWLFKPELLMV